MSSRPLSDLHKAMLSVSNERFEEAESAVKAAMAVRDAAGRDFQDSIRHFVDMGHDETVVGLHVGLGRNGVLRKVRKSRQRTANQEATA